MAEKKKKTNTHEFEEKMQRLEQIVKELESSELSLEEGLALYKEGAICSKFCREKLDQARHELEIWREGKAIPAELSDLDKIE